MHKVDIFFYRFIVLINFCATRLGILFYFFYFQLVLKPVVIVYLYTYMSFIEQHFIFYY